MKARHLLFISIAIFVLFSGISCGSGIGNLFTGSQWTVGANHISFNHVTAKRETAANQLVLEFNLLSNASFPDAMVIVDSLTTLQINESREVSVLLRIAAGDTYQTGTDAIATIIFHQLDFAATGAVSGTLSGQLQHVETPDEAPVDLSASFEDVMVSE
ncbi:MAG: hypothetical protein NTY09_15115 [bacterium]|nr:hypothetical protein [bacterium]